MYKKIAIYSFVAAVTVGFLGACSSGLKPLAADYIKAEPQPLELTAGKVPVTINATFPAGWFDKKATLVVTPVLRYNGGEVWGTSYTYQGEKVAGNGQVIPQKAGGNATLKSSFDYVPAMQKSDLYLALSAKIGNKEIPLPEIKIGEGVLATAALLDASSELPAIASDKFQKILKEAHNADIMFLIQQAELRSGELKKADLAQWKTLVANANKADNQQVNVEISAYASPDGGVELNEKLAGKREDNTNKYLKSELQKSKADIPVTTRYTAQDWEGFKELVEKSNIQDKNLILSVLSMYKDSEQREKEIKNISSVYSVLADEILPQLRRSRLTANIEIIGKSDEEISKSAASNPQSLNIEELLYAATLTDLPSEKESIYKKVTELYPNDYRAHNNLGAVEYLKGNLSVAEKYFEKSLSISASPEANLNLGLASIAKGDSDKAQQFLGKAAGASELGNATGLIDIANGNYSKAVDAFGKTASNNAALAQLLNKDYSRALSTLNAVAKPNATTAYLKAIVAARTNNSNDVVANLKQAVQLDASLAGKAAADLEFVKYFTNESFLNIVK
jgi:Flp pilus assembly protein TadD